MCSRGWGSIAVPAPEVMCATGDSAGVWAEVAQKGELPVLFVDLSF